MVSDNLKKWGTLAFPITGLLLTIFLLFGSFGYVKHISDEAKMDACESTYGANSTWVTDTDSGQGIVCTTPDGVGLTDYEEPRFRIGGYVDYIVSFGGGGDD